MAVRKIVLLGPESSGKSTLAAALGDHFGCPWHPEQARFFLERSAGKYGFEDLYRIAKLQIESEKDWEYSERHAQAGLCFLDTNILMIQAWSEIVFGRCDNRILTSVAELRYDYYFLCRPDIPWQPDPLREHPEEKDRRRIFSHYLEMLKNQHLPFSVLEGPFESRLARAVEAVASLVK